MKAVVFTDRADFRLDDRPIPAASPGKLLLKIGLCGICGTDLNASKFAGLFIPGVIVGHEFVARVIEVGAGVEGFEVGDRVVVNPNADVCGVCDACRRGVPNQCPIALMQRSCGIHVDGGMAEYAAIDRVQIHRVPDSLPDTVAAWTEPVAVSVRGLNRAHMSIGMSVAVLGAGPIGQLTLQTALAAGAGESLVVDFSSYRRDVALGCGAGAAVAPGRVGEIDRLFDVVFDCTGVAAALDTAVELVEHAGRIVVIGTNQAPVTMSAPMTAHLKEATIAFSMAYRDRHEFATALRLLERSTVDVAPLTTATMGITEHADAFEAQRNHGSAIKVLLDPSR